MTRRLLFLYVVVLAVATCGSPAPTSAPTPSPAALTATLAASASLLASPSPTPPTPTPAELGRSARVHIVALGAIGPRVAGTSAEATAAAYVSSALRSAGYEPDTLPFTATGWSGLVNSANVVAIKAGASTRQIVVGAHYDSTSRGLGADDNASGVAALLELAGLLADRPTPYTIVFVAFGAEEVGFLGSKTYVAHMSATDRANTVAMVNLDSVVGGDFQYLYSDEGTRAAARDWALTWASDHGLDLRTIRNVDLNDEEGNPCSDYGPFQAIGIPFVYVEATDWTVGAKDGWTQVSPKLADKGVIRHTRFDTLSYLDSTFPGRVDTRLALTVAVVYALLTKYEQ